jgi:hypothetical protein
MSTWYHCGMMRYVIPVLCCTAVLLASDGRAKVDRSVLRVHVVVALCDNEHQGIVPVRAELGDGDDPAHNLYWGARYGVKSFFRRARGWTLVSTTRPEDGDVLERVVFRRRIGDRTVYLLAEAYRGRAIRAATEAFLAMAAGRRSMQVEVGGTTHAFGGGADLVAYVGHDGLMDFEIDNPPAWREGSGRRDVIILACAAKQHFASALRRAKARPLVWSTGLMAAEAYPLHAALEGWARGETAEAVCARAARAYARYQKCSAAAARRLLVPGW